MPDTNNQLKSVLQKEPNFWIKNGILLIVCFFILCFFSLGVIYSKYIYVNNKTFSAKVINVNEISYDEAEKNYILMVFLELSNVNLKDINSTKKIILQSDSTKITMTVEKAYYTDLDSSNSRIINLIVTTPISNLSENRIALNKLDFVKITPKNNKIKDYFNAF